MKKILVLDKKNPQDVIGEFNSIEDAQAHVIDLAQEDEDISIFDYSIKEVEYEDVSTTSNHWSGFIVKAIKAYDPKRDAEVERLRDECADLNLIIATKLNEIAALKKQVEEKDKEIGYLKTLWDDQFPAVRNMPAGNIFDGPK